MSHDILSMIVELDKLLGKMEAPAAPCALCKPNDLCWFHRPTFMQGQIVPAFETEEKL